MSASDCGAAALCMVLGLHGCHVTLGEVRERLDTGRNGATASSLLRVGRFYGLRGRGVSAEMDDIPSLPLGSILFWQFRHYVVLEQVESEFVRIADPAIGRRRISIADFRRAFTGVALLFEPSQAFQRTGSAGSGTWPILRRVVKPLRLLARILAISALIQGLAAVMPILTGVLIDRVVPQRSYSLLLVLALAYAASQIFSGAAGYFRAYLLLYLQRDVEADFTFSFLDHLIELPYSFFQQRSAGDLMMRLSSNSSIREIVTSTTLSTLTDGIMASLYVVLLMVANVPLTLIVVVIVAARIGLVLMMRKRQRALLAESLEAMAHSQTYQVEMLSGMETLKAMGLEHRAAENWSNVFLDGLNIMLSRGRLEALFNMLQNFLSGASTLSVMFYGTYLVLQGRFTLGTMVAYAALASAFFLPFSNLLSAGIQFQMLQSYLERINDVLNSAPEQALGAATPAPRLTGAISMHEVSFRYAKSDPLVIENVTITVMPGSRVALVGATGSGKSTLARLMVGLYTPSSGRISFDDKELRTLDLRSLRNQLGFVAQDTQLFGGTIRQNIALADPQMSLDRIIQAAKLACIHNEITGMPMGYETILADRGLSLSGGQRQRLALARALACQPNILVLDEATSHLDSVTEQSVNQNLKQLRCTRIVIAHRLSTIRDADKVVLLHLGRVIGQGTHVSLLARSPEYSELIAAQQDQLTEIRSRGISASRQ